MTALVAGRSISEGVPPGATRPTSRTRAILRAKPLWGAVGVAVALLIWQLATTVGGIRPTVLPNPVDVLTAFQEHRHLLLSNAGYTLRTILIGFAISVGIGTGLAMLMQASAMVDGLLTPIVVAVQTVPKIAVIPIILAWFGIGQTSGLVIVILITVFPILVNTRLGFNSVDQEFKSMGRVMGGSRVGIFSKIELPLALPSIFGGLEVGMTLAVTGAAGAEMFAGSEGIAFVMQVASSALRMDLAFAALTVITVMGVVLYYAIKLGAWALMPWTRPQR